ncbi:hypothetical protein VTK56DRAFT_4279 [Thermocarpiscus australiensis]
MSAKYFPERLSRARFSRSSLADRDGVCETGESPVLRVISGAMAYNTTSKGPSQSASAVAKLRPGTKTPTSAANALLKQISSPKTL